MRRVCICSVAFLICIGFVLPTQAFFNSDVKKAIGFMQADMYTQAIELLTKRINEKPTDAEAHYLLGICQLKNNKLSSADKSFSLAAKFDAGYKPRIIKYYKKLSEIYLKYYNLDAAEFCYGRMIEYDPSLKDPEYLKQVGYRYLKKAAESNGPARELYKRRATGLIGKDISKEVFPEPYMKTVIDKVIPSSEANEKGKLPIFIWGVDDIKTYDECHVIAKLKPGKKLNYPVLAYPNPYPKGKKDNWVKVDGLEFNQKITKTTFPVGVPFSILIDMAEVESVRLKIKRHSTLEPNLTLLNSLIK